MANFLDLPAELMGMVFSHMDQSNGRHCIMRATLTNGDKCHILLVRGGDKTTFEKIRDQTRMPAICLPQRVLRERWHTYQQLQVRRTWEPLMAEVRKVGRLTMAALLAMQPPDPTYQLWLWIRATGWHDPPEYTLTFSAALAPKTTSPPPVRWNLCLSLRAPGCPKNIYREGIGIAYYRPEHPLQKYNLDSSAAFDRWKRAWYWCNDKGFKQYLGQQDSHQRYPKFPDNFKTLLDGALYEIIPWDQFSGPLPTTSIFFTPKLTPAQQMSKVSDFSQWQGDLDEEEYAAHLKEKFLREGA